MNRSLTLCASIVLLSPLALAVSAGDFKFDIGAGMRNTTWGDPAGTKKALMVGEASATRLTGGESTSASISVPSLTLSASMGFNDKFRFSAEGYLSTSDSRAVADGYSHVVSDVQLELSAAADFSTTTNMDSGGHRLTVGANTAGGVRTFTVSPKAALALKGEYLFGADDNGAAIGLALLRTSDELKYLSQTQGATTAAAADSAPDVVTIAATTNAVATTFDDGVFWIGGTASATSKINDNMSMRAGMGYYIRDFDKSPAPTTTTAMLFSAEVPATSFIGNISIGFSKS